MWGLMQQYTHQVHGKNVQHHFYVKYKSCPIILNIINFLRKEQRCPPQDRYLDRISAAV